MVVVTDNLFSEEQVDKILYGKKSILVVSGNTYSAKEALKSWGCRWDSDSKAWISPEFDPEETDMNIMIKDLKKHAGLKFEKIQI